MASKRIVSLLAAGTEILYALGLGDRVVAISHECDYPVEATFKPRVTSTHIDAAADSLKIDQQVRELSAAGASLYDVDVDRLASLAPDLIVTQVQCDVCAVSEHLLRAALAKRDVFKSTAVVTLNPVSLDAVFDDILRVGEAAGRLDTAREYVAGLKSRVAVVQTVTASLADEARPRVICLEWIEPPIVAANWMPRLVEIAGGRNGLTKAAQRSGPTKWENVVSYDPEVIVVMPCGFPLERALSEAPRLQSFPHWSGLHAVRDGRVYAVDGNAYFNRSGPRIVDSLEILAGLIHPARFERLAQRYADAWQCFE